MVENILQKIASKILKFIDNFDLSHLYIAIALVVLVLLLEYVFEGWESSSLKKVLRFKKTTNVDLFYLIVFNFKIYGIIEIISTFGLVILLTKIKFVFNYSLYAIIKNEFIYILILFVIFDFVTYWIHRWFHYSDKLWELHAYHHSATDYNIFIFFRHHFWEDAAIRLAMIIPNLLMGGNAYNFLILNLIFYFFTLLHHSNINSNWGWLGKNLLVSPNNHRIHHSIDSRFYNKNFGAILIIWDRMFNTYIETREVITVGVPNNPYNRKGFIYDIFLVIKNFLYSFRFNMKL